MKLLTALATDLPEEADGVKLLADRDGDDTGVVLTVEFTPKMGEASGKPTGWSSQKRVRAGGRSLLGSFGSSAHGYGISTDGHKDLSEAIDEALNTTPEIPVEIRVSLREQN